MKYVGSFPHNDATVVDFLDQGTLELSVRAGITEF